MAKFISVEDFPVRPLQLAVGAATTATGTYYYVKQTTGEKATTPGGTTFSQSWCNYEVLSLLLSF